MENFGLRFFKGSVSLIARQLIIKGLNFIVLVILTRTLTPEVFGLWALINLVTNYLNMFGDLGMGAGLVQSNRKIEDGDRTLLLIWQLGFALMMIVVGVLVSPHLARLYNLPSDQTWLFAFIALGFIPAAFQAPSMIGLEKELEYNKIALIETLGSTVSSTLLLVFALSGFQGWTFVMAGLGSSAFSAAAAYFLAPWKFNLSFDWQRAKNLLKFGIPYQASGWVSLLKDSFAPTVLTFLLGMSQLGVYKWASSLAIYPVTFLSIIQRMFFPFFSRVKDDITKLARVAGELYYILMFGVCLGVSLLYSLSYPITTLVFGSRWVEGIPLFKWMIIGLPFVPGTMVAMAILNALGKSKINFVFSLMWMSIEWLLGSILVRYWGLEGYGVALFINQFSNIVVYWYISRYVQVRWLLSGVPIIASSLVTYSLLYLLQQILPVHSVSGLIGFGIIGTVVFSAANFLFFPKQLTALVSRMLEYSRTRINAKGAK